MSVYFCISLSENFCSKDAVFYLVGIVLGGGGGGGKIILFRQVAVWATKNVLRFFILIEIFENSTFFQHFDTFIYIGLKD